MPETIDARGLKCPEPAIRTGRALKDHDSITVIVDDEDAVKNISRGVEKRGYEVRVERREKDIYLHIDKQEGASGMNEEFPIYCGPKDTVVLFASDTIGRGDDELGGVLTKSILYSFTEVEPKPHTMIFMNSGVKLVVEGSDVLEDIGKLAQGGVQILACGTCLDFFDLKDKIKVGEISNAYTISETLLEAGKVVRF
ncbi:MAG: sulfurtransferase-like selenium metabolism protein YedF [Thermoplasmata archaeon]|nr:MAG: sulfurtransferase-like selenium metabolism protein YedF [Thermoplasmata archaeon]